MEDDASVRGLAPSALDSAGFCVLEADDGMGALAVARRHAGRIHLVMSALVMPRMGGAELADRLRELDPELQILFVSGDRSPFAGDEHEPALLYRPFTGSQLVAEARRVLDAAGAGPARA